MNWRQFLTPVKSIDTNEAKAYLQDKNLDEVTLLDVRQPKEYESGHIPGAVHVAWEMFAQTEGAPGKGWGVLLPAKALARVVGNVTSTINTPHFEDRTLLLCDLVASTRLVERVGDRGERRGVDDHVVGQLLGLGDHVLDVFHPSSLLALPLVQTLTLPW